MEKERTIIVKEKSEGGAIKLAAILALVATSPFWMVLGIVFIGCVAGIVSNGGAWPFIALLALSLVPAIRDRISGKNDSKRLQERITQLELENSEVRLQLAQLEESIAFDQTLKLHAEQTPAKSEAVSASSGQLVKSK